MENDKTQHTQQTVATREELETMLWNAIEDNIWPTVFNDEIKKKLSDDFANVGCSIEDQITALEKEIIFNGHTLETLSEHVREVTFKLRNKFRLVIQSYSNP